MKRVDFAVAPKKCCFIYNDTYVVVVGFGSEGQDSRLMAVGCSYEEALKEKEEIEECGDPSFPDDVRILSTSEFCDEYCFVFPGILAGHPMIELDWNK